MALELHERILISAQGALIYLLIHTFIHCVLNPGVLRQIERERIHINLSRRLSESQNRYEHGDKEKIL